MQHELGVVHGFANELDVRDAAFDEGDFVANLGETVFFAAGKIIEDDHASVVAGAPYTSLIPDGWCRWAVLRSVSKVLHPDMRKRVGEPLLEGGSRWLAVRGDADGRGSYFTIRKRVRAGSPAAAPVNGVATSV